MQLQKDLIFSGLKKSAPAVMTYIATLYYAEIIYLMVFLNFLYGKAVSVTVGMILSFLLVCHVVGLFIKKDLNRKIQLFIMDLHIAYSSAYIFNRCFSGNVITFIDGTVIAFRLMLLFAEIAMILFLTENEVKKRYSG